MSTITLLAAAVVVLLAGALLALPLARRGRLAGWSATLVVAVAGAAVWVVAIRAFLAATGEPASLTLPGVAGRLTVIVDPLSALFLVIVATIAALTTLYSVDYMAHAATAVLARFYPLLLLLFAAVVGALVAGDAVLFLVCWEVMTLATFFLVTCERGTAAGRRAGIKYLAFAHAATLCLVVAGLLLWREGGSLELAALRRTLAALLVSRPLEAHAVLALLFLGFATHAGVLPMGGWLADADPAAPSPMGAALSAAVVKVGIYSIVRFFCPLLPATAAAVPWGVAIAVAGTASMFVGTLTALRQSDGKRLMAFHTSGQMGYVLLAVGVAVACSPSSPALGALALAGALFHAVNHACFKACLLLGAGAVLHRSGERDMNRLGGMAAAMPVTAGSTTVAALAIAGVPPLSGFASKWLIVVTCLLAGLRQPPFLPLALVAMFVSLVTLASFLKVLGAVFLGAPDPARRVREAPATMVAPQVLLAALCVLLGVLPFLPLRLVRDAASASLPAAVPSAGELFGGPWALAIGSGGLTVAMWAPLAVLSGLAVLGLLALGLQHAGGARTRRVPVWACGEEHAPALVRYPASSLYLPFKRAFVGVRVWAVPGVVAVVAIALLLVG